MQNTDMPNHTTMPIANLALIKVNWDNNNNANGNIQRIDSIQNFVPFVVTLIHRKNYKTIEVNEICKDFELEYGLRIPYHPMRAILSRTMSNGYIQKKGVNFVPVHGKIVENNFTEIAKEQERKYKRVLSAFLDFCLTDYKQLLSEAEAENVFISFLKDHDLDILFMSQQYNTFLPDVTSPVQHKYLMNGFIANVHEYNPEIFSFITDISLGHIIANTLSTSYLDNYNEPPKDAHFYLDVDILFNIVGVNGKENKKAYEIFLQSLSQLGISLSVFKHTYDEFSGILRGCRKWVESQHIDASKASSATLYFIDNQFTPSDVDEFILHIEPRLEELKIQIAPTLDYSIDERHQIDNRNLQDSIISIYRDRLPYFDESEKEHTLDRDIKSISAIYRLRKDSRPSNWQDVKYLFLTTNSSLALASRNFEAQNFYNINDDFIPAVVTDIFAGTLIWIQSPSKVTEINSQRLIANSYAALQPNKALIKNLVDTAQKLKDRGEITSEQLVLLTQTHVARNFLQKETLGDPNSFTEKTPFEILKDMEIKIQNDERKKFEHERQESQRKEEILLVNVEEAKSIAEMATRELERERLEKEKRREHNEKLATKIANNIAGVYYLTTCAVIVGLLIFQVYSASAEIDSLVKIVINVIVVLLSIFNLVTGFNVQGSRNALYTRLKERILLILQPNNHSTIEN